MGSGRIFIFSLLCIFSHVSTEASRLKISKNGYEDLLISLPANASSGDRPKLISSLKVILEQSSELLYKGTNGRAFFRSVVFLIPSEWGGTNAWRPRGENVTSFEDAPPVFSRGGADVTVTLGHDQPYVLHHQGCGYKAKGISLPMSFLLGEAEDKGKVFIDLWSEFRYGIFKEKGFEGDKKYPVSYLIPGDPVNRTTDCNLDFFREVNVEENGGNYHSSNNLHGPSFIPREGLFCEGYLTLGRNHNPEAPSKHNLLCGEQGTWFIVRRSPDFANGRNAARLHTDRGLNFRFVREISTPKVLVAIEISARMGHEDRYAMAQNAFAHFVSTLLPDGSQLSLVVFGGDTGVSVVTSAVSLADEAAKIAYLEGAPLPDETAAVEDVCLDCVLDEVFKLLPDDSPAEIILITSQSSIAASRRDDLRRVIGRSESRLHVLSFMDDHPDASYATASVADLCLETGVHFVSLRSDPFGDLYRGFGDVVRETSKKVMIHQKYLPIQDDEDMEISFTIDSALSTDLKVTLSGPTFNTPLVYSSTSLIVPGGDKFPKKQELVPSWVFQIQNPKAGEYKLRTRRKFARNEPILLSVTSSTSEESVTAKVWVEILDSKAVPSPIQIFAEVKQGHFPVVNANVVAHIHHPESDGSSVVPLLDDGQGNVDITEGDGIYSYTYTNFTSSGFYNVNVKVVGNDNTTVLKGPSSACCGSSFPYRDQSRTGPFQREAGPATFHVKSLPNGDPYPPSQVTDLRIFKTYDNDKIVVLRWTAVGDNYNSGVASRYEVKLFRDRFFLRHHFGDPTAAYSDEAATTEAAAAGTPLVHQARLTSPGLARGPHYFAVRAVDAAGNAGPPSNAVPLWLERPARRINCDDDHDFEE